MLVSSNLECNGDHRMGTDWTNPTGKILPDTKTVESCGIKEKDFLVLMISKVSRR